MTPTWSCATLYADGPTERAERRAAGERVRPVMTKSASAAQPLGLLAGEVFEDREEVAHRPTLTGRATPDLATTDLLTRSVARLLHQRQETPARQPRVPPDVVRPRLRASRMVLHNLPPVPFDPGG